MAKQAYWFYVPINNLENAQKLAKQLVQERLCACANVIPKIYSYYWWEGKVTEDTEAIVILKTLSDQVETLTQRIKTLHPYSVPAILAFPIEKINSDYFEWLENELSKH